MDIKIPSFSTQEVDLHIRTYRSLLKSAGEVRIEQLIDSHVGMKSLLHEKGATDTIDMSAFIYCLLRLPSCMSTVTTVVLGQSYSVFKKNGWGKIIRWKEVSAPGRRRKMYFNGRDTLAVYITSVSDVDDIITLLTAFQIEWNKFHMKLREVKDVALKTKTLLDPEDVQKIQNIWGDEYHKFLTAIKHRTVNVTVKLIEGSYIEYAKATQQWLDHIMFMSKRLNLHKRPVYFISSNLHSITNLLTRTALEKEKELIKFLYETKDATLIGVWEGIERKAYPIHRDHFLYYLAKKYVKIDKDLIDRKRAKERLFGIRHISALHYLDIDAQIIEVSKLSQATLDERLHLTMAGLAKSRSVIINIDYPLGWAAYQVLTEIGQNVDEVRGVYIMGKAATLNGQIGDIMIPNTIFDSHTKNIYVIQNAFSRTDFTPLFNAGSILDQQKTLTAKGTVLQNKKNIEEWYKQGYETIEMEAGPYMNATYEYAFYNRYEEGQFINLTKPPFELGIVHYASDTPYSKAKNLGVRNLSYDGIESTYAISLAILKKIVQRELSFLE